MSDDERSWKEKAMKAISILENISKPPLLLATVLDVYDSQLNVATVKGDTYVVSFDPRLKGKLKEGQTVELSPESFAVVKIDGNVKSNSVTTVKDVLPDGRVQIEGQRGIMMAKSIADKLKPGDSVVVDNSYSIVLENLGSKTNAYHLDKVPNTPWSSIGGLENTITEIQEAIEMPFVHKDIYSKFPNKKLIKGALLHGPPGCGKTLLGKGIAYNLAKRKQENDGGALNGYFLYLAGPEFLKKFVGEGERMIRELFGNARETAKQNGDPVIIFIDEAEHALKQRGSGISSDATDPLVNQFLAEMDGMSPTDNILVLLASNRPELFDSGIIRPGRIDRKIYVPRPNQAGAEQIFSIYLKDVPLQKNKLFDSGSRLQKDYARFAAENVFDPSKSVMDITYADGSKDVVTYAKMFSGASAVSIIDRATDIAIRRSIEGGKPELVRQDIADAVAKEYMENRSLTNQVTTEDIKDIARDRFEMIREIRPSRVYGGANVN